MTMAEIEDAIRNLTENSVQRFAIRNWMAVEIGRIVNRKYYWWRKKIIDFTSAPATPLYDFTAINSGAFKDFQYFASSLYRFNSDGSQSEIPFVDDNRQRIQMVKDTTSGPPTLMTIEPGTTKVLRFSPCPVSADEYVGLYYAGYEINWSSPGDKTVPLIPSQFHYVVLASMERRAFQYLYGQKDPRAILAAQAEQMALSDLDTYKSPSSINALEWRSSDEKSFIQSTQ